MFSLYSGRFGHTRAERHSFALRVWLDFSPIFPHSPSSLCLSTLPQPLTMGPFMWPHFETRRGGLEGARGDTQGGRLGEEGGRREFGGGLALFSSPRLFYEGRNIIFSTQALPRHSPRAVLRRLKCQPR